MRKFRNLLVIICIAIFPILSSAAALSSKIMLSGGSIPPYQHLEISFSKLLEGVFYRVECENIVSNNKANQDVDFIKLYSTDSNLQPMMNGNHLVQSWQSYILTKSPNQLRIRNVTLASASIIIRNLDDTDTITVKNCYALPEV